MLRKLPIKEPEEKNVSEMTDESLLDYVIHCSSMISMPMNRNRGLFEREFKKSKSELLIRLQNKRRKKS